MEERPPYEAYAAIMCAFFGGLAATGLLARALGREPREHDALDLLTLAAANFKAARTLAHDEVTSFLREPFVQGHAHEGGEEPERGGMRQRSASSSRARDASARGPQPVWPRRRCSGRASDASSRGR